MRALHERDWRGVTPLPTRVARERSLVCIIDDHQLMSSLLVGLLRRAGYDAESAYDTTGDEVRRRLDELRPDLVLLDFDLGPLSSGMRYLEAALQHDAVVVGLTACEDPLEHARYLEAGVVVVVSKTAGPTEVLATVELALAGHDVMASSQRQRLLRDLRLARDRERKVMQTFERLTTRERQVLAALCDGLTAAAIAEEWVVSLATVRSHIRSVLLKLGVNSQLEAVAKAQAAGWEAPATGSSILMMTPPDEPSTMVLQRKSSG